MIKPFLLTFFVVHFILNQAVASSSPLRFLTVNEPPASYLDEDGQIQGYVVDIFRSLAQRLEVDAKLEVVPEARALRTAYHNDNTMVFSFSRNAERDQKLNWIGPVLIKTWGLYGLKSFQHDYENLADYPTIGVTKGDIRHEWLANQGLSNLSVNSSHQLNIQLLVRERVSTIAYEGAGLQIVANELDIDPTSFKLLKTLKQQGVYIAMSKHFTKAEQWQQAFEDMQSEGELQKIAEKWRDKIKQQHGVDTQISKSILILK
ncbi:substrate-binding periplasmic protein [Agarivorans aestuarii]|uniref:substrate-binding periplasmic protein n=1 Tax=Agarivorans aestuarii TaxID=1563703 RepID=UPI001C7EB8CE|nr:transporter substrate-binding domain-containing protein [Agarivorans aestuarii]